MSRRSYSFFLVRSRRHLLASALCVLLMGCAAAKVADEALGDLAKNLLQSAALRRPELPASVPLSVPVPVEKSPGVGLSQSPRKVSLAVHAGVAMNLDATGQPLSLVLRIYKLKNAAAFQQAPYEVFAGGDGGRAALAGDLVEMSELTVVPGQRYVLEAAVPREAAVLGVVALFHAPAPQRWRFTFDTSSAERTGVLLGAHGCALTVARGELVGTAFDAERLGGVQCGT